MVLQQLVNLRCPACAPAGGGALSEVAGDLACNDCGQTYPVVEGVPVMLTEATDHFGLLKEIANTRGSNGTSA